MEDEELVLMSSMVKKFIKKKNDTARSRNKDRAPAKKKDASTVTFFNCGGKGHFAKECSQPKKKEQDPPTKEEKKVFFTGAWGESDSEVDDKEDPDCLMARSDSEDEEIKVTDLKPKLLKRPDLVDLAEHLIEENASCTRQIDELEDEITSLRKENAHLLRKVEDRPPVSVKTICMTCKGKQTVDPGQDRALCVEDRDLIFSKLNKLSEKIDSMAVPQTVFVRSRAGLGYDGSQTGSTSDEKDKLVIELRQRVETLDQALDACKGSNQFFKDKIHVLEGSPTQEKSWFEGHKVHHMYQKQAKGKAKPTKLEKKAKNYPGRGKYGCTPNFDICMYCGGNWHRWQFCAKRQEDQARRTSKAKGKGGSQAPQARSTPTKPKIRQPNARKVHTIKKPLPVSNVPVKGPDLVISGANTTKPLKVWVVKT